MTSAVNRAGPPAMRLGRWSPAAAARAGPGVVGAVEALEDVGGLFGGHAGPWSATVSWTPPGTVVTVMVTGDSGGVCWMALPIRLSMTCRIRSASTREEAKDG